MFSFSSPLILWILVRHRYLPIPFRIVHFLSRFFDDCCQHLLDSAMRFTASCVQIFLFAIHRVAGRDTPCRRSGQNESGLMRERRNEGSGIAEPGRQHLWHLPPWRPAGPSTLPRSKTQGAKHMMVARENAPKHLLCGNKSRPSLFRFSHQYVPCI